MSTYLEEAIALVKQLLPQGCLTKVEEIIFRQFWARKTYLDMAVKSNYDHGHIKNLGSELWRMFLESFGEIMKRISSKG